MDKQLWINIGLLVFIGILSLFLLNTEGETKKELPLLSTIDRNDIVEINVSRKDREDYIFNKQGDTWVMSSPQKFRANKSRINAMLRILSVRSHSQLNPAEIELETMGLKNPVIFIKLNSHEFVFGNIDAIDRRRYVLFDGEIHLTNDFLYHQLLTHPAFFASTRLLPEKTEIYSIQFPENKIELINDHWQLQTLMDISPDQLKRIAFNWKNTEAISVSKYEAPEEERFISLSIAESKLIKFVIVATEPHLILGRKDMNIQYHMGSDETEKLLLKDISETEDHKETPGVE